jgi:prevent-host-death family protein
MVKDMPITTARHALTSLPEQLEQDPSTIAITRRGKPVLAVMPWELYESLMETLEILGDPEFMAALRQTIKDAEAGKGIPWEEAKRELGL